MGKILAVLIFVISTQIPASELLDTKRNIEIDEILIGLDSINTTNFNCDPDLHLSKLRDVKGKEIPASVMSLEHLNQIFKVIASDPKIPFKYAQDGCNARAQEMSRILDKHGVTSAKIFIEGDLKVKTENSPKGYFEWWYHVAPAVKVKVGNKVMVYVIDPSIFDRPVPVEDWIKSQTSHSEEASKSKVIFFTNRYHYCVQDRDNVMTSYDKDNLLAGQGIMEANLSIQKEMMKGKK
jgi:hypothetical protein